MMTLAWKFWYLKLRLSHINFWLITGHILFIFDTWSMRRTNDDTRPTGIQIRRVVCHGQVRDLIGSFQASLASFLFTALQSPQNYNALFSQLVRKCVVKLTLEQSMEEKEIIFFFKSWKLFYSVGKIAKNVHVVYLERMDILAFVAENQRVQKPCYNSPFSSWVTS